MSGYRGVAVESDGTSEYNRMLRVVRSVLDKAVTATLVQVKAVSAGGLVDIQPMIAQIDGNGDGTPHGTIHNVPVWRLQGGVAAVIIDPVVGDIGLAVFAHNDISTAKTTKKPALPGSRRKFDWADAIYLGGLLNAAPTQFLKIEPSGITLTGTGTVAINAPGGLTVTGNLTVTGVTTLGGKVFSTHTHSGVTAGGGTSGPVV